MRFKGRMEFVKEGVLQAVGLPVETPVCILGEQLPKPTPMLYRDMLAMEVEDVLFSNPVDGATVH